MPKATRFDMIAAGKEAVARDVQYIYGAKPSGGEFRRYTAVEINNLRSQYGSDCVWWSDTSKAGSLCCDCSGLITKGCGVLRGSGGFRSTADEDLPVGKVWDDWQKYIGWALWMPGHIGIVSDVEGYYYALDGSARNSVHYPMSRQGWTRLLKLCDVDYSEPYEEEDEVKPEDIEKIAQRVSEYMTDGRMQSGACIIQPYGVEQQYYFDGGSRLVALTHPDQPKALDMVYQTVYGGDIPRMVLGSEGAPWFSRLLQACGYQSAGEIPEANVHAWL